MAQTGKEIEVKQMKMKPAFAMTEHESAESNPPEHAV